MGNLANPSLLTLLKEVRTLIDKGLKNKLHYGNFTIPQTMIIYYLAQDGKMKISELSEKMGLTNSTISGIIDRLEDQKVVTRQRCTVDRRVVYVELTPEHSKKTLEHSEDLDRYFEDITLEIPDEQINFIMESLTILKDTLSRHSAEQK